MNYRTAVGRVPLPIILGIVGIVVALVFRALGAAASEGIPCTSERMPMEYGDLVTCRIDPVGDSDSFVFQGTFGDVMMVQASRQSGGFPCVELHRPDGSLVEPPGRACAAPFSARIDATLDQTGTYTVLVTEDNNDQIMAYSLSLQCVSASGCPGVDRVQILTASFFWSPFDLLFVAAASSAAPLAQLSVTIPGCVENAPMEFRPTTGKYYFQTNACPGLVADSAMVISDSLGSDTAPIEYFTIDATLSVSPTSVPAGGEVTASWAGIPAPSPTDWLGLYATGAPDSDYLALQYTTGTESGSVDFQLPATVDPGTYELRLFSNDTSTRLATSNPFTVTP